MIKEENPGNEMRKIMEDKTDILEVNKLKVDAYIQVVDDILYKVKKNKEESILYKKVRLFEAQVLVNICLDFFGGDYEIHVNNIYYTTLQELSNEVNKRMKEFKINKQ